MPEFILASPDPQVLRYLERYPPGLFSERLFQSGELVDRYGLDLAIDLAQRLGLEAVIGRPVSLRQISRRLSFAPAFEPALRWLLDRLVAAGFAHREESDEATRYQIASPLRAPELPHLRAVGLAIDPRNTAALALLDAAAAAYPAVARGETTGEEALFSAGQAALWFDYFNNDNPTYAINNRLAACAVVDRCADRAGLRLLEVGAGGGSGSAAVLEALAASQLTDRLASYSITEPSPFFRRRGERFLRAQFPGLPLQFGQLDINQPWAPQGTTAGSMDIILGVNVLHVARHLVFSLREAFLALAPGGFLVLGECVRLFPGQPIAAELIFQILDSFTSVQTDPVTRPSHGFLTPEEWSRATTAAGFEPPVIEPDLCRLREIYPRFFTGAICCRRPL